MPAPGIIIGRGLAYWTTTMRLAGSLVAREGFLLGLQEIHSYYARWEPILSGIDGAMAAKLATRIREPG